MTRPTTAPDTQKSEQASSGWFWGQFAPLGATVALITLLLDQSNKLWMLLFYGIADRGRVEVTPFLDFVYVLNTGVSYSMFDSSSRSWQLGLAAFAFIASLIMWVWLCKAGESRVMAAGLGLIIGGAIGNAIDRLWLGGVADFYSLHAFGFYWYIFNIADVAIVVGVVSLLYDSFIASRKDAANIS
jgi:signal peptidase II